MAGLLVTYNHKNMRLKLVASVSSWHTSRSDPWDGQFDLVAFDATLD